MASHIYHGFWINWSQGAVRGATVTIGDRSGGLLTSFIATFVTLVSTQLWRILCFVLHQVRSNKAPQDGLHHQQQVVFRNTATPGGAAWTFLQQSWFWRNKARLTFLRTLPWALFSIAYLVLFALAAIFSSDISKSSGSTRLIVGDQCGLWSVNATNPNALAAYSAKVTNDSLVAASYARACYGGSYDPLQCGRYSVSNLKWTANRNASCPFESGMCYYGDTAAYAMTTPRLNSHHDLGINTPERDRMEYIKTTTCAPIHGTNYSELINVTATQRSLGRVGDQVVEVYFGPLTDDDQIITNSTYYYNTHALIDAIGWSVSSVEALAGNQGFIPVPALNQTPGDLSIVFIAQNSIRFRAPCDDPVFAAHQLVNQTATDPSLPAFWDQDHYVGYIACMESHTLCNPTNNVCTPSLGIAQLLPYLTSTLEPTTLNLNTFQIALSARLVQAAMYTSIYHQTTTRMGTALRAQDTVNELDQSPLPPNQWMIEVGSWFDTGLARMQRAVQEFATGPSNVVDGTYVWLPNLLAEKVMCYSQIVNDSTNTMSFSVLGMIILFGTGGLIMLSSLCIERITGWVQKKLGKGLYARMAWLVDDKLQLQRLLFQESGQGVWSRSSEDSVPVTEEKGRFVGIGAIHGHGGSQDIDGGVVGMGGTGGGRNGGKYGIVSGGESPLESPQMGMRTEKEPGVYVYDR